MKLSRMLMDPDDPTEYMLTTELPLIKVGDTPKYLDTDILAFSVTLRLCHLPVPSIEWVPVPVRTTIEDYRNGNL